MLLILPCQTCEVLESEWAGGLFSLDSTKKSASLKKGQKSAPTLNVFPGSGVVNVPV